MTTAIHKPNSRERKSSIHQTEEALRKAHAQMELVLSSITSILIGIDERGYVTHWNSVAEKTFWLHAKRVLSRPVSSLNIRWNLEMILAGIQECRSKERSIRLDDVPFERIGGQKGFLGWTLIPIPQNADGRFECILFGADITERKRIEQLKDEFVSTVSHELRTPLTMIKEGVSQVAEGIMGEVNEEQRKFLSIVLEGIDRLRRIVDDLLDTSKIEAGKAELHRELVDVVSLAKGVALAFNYQAHERGLEIKTHFPVGKIEVYLDKDKIIQVFTNLVSNALKFTEKGSIGIWVEDKGRAVECWLSDRGRGIAEEDVPKLFGKFQQFGRAKGPGEKGTGLGLAISKGIVELHHGKIWVESKLGEGTKIKFLLPKYTAKELFHDQVVRSLRQALLHQTPLSFIVFEIDDLEAPSQKLHSERLVSLIQDFEHLIRRNVRPRTTVATRDDRAILIALPETKKEEGLVVAGRIHQTFDDYLVKQKMRKQINVVGKVISYPEDGKNEAEILTKVV